MPVAHLGARAGGQPVQVVDIDNPLGLETSHRAAVPEMGPVQIDAGVGVHHSGSLGEGIDAGDAAVGRVVGYIADAAVPGQSAGNGPLDKLGPVQPGVIGAHRGVGGVQGAVQDLHIRVESGLPDAGEQQLWGGGEDDVGAPAHCILHGLVYLPIGADVLVGEGAHLTVGEVLQNVPAILVAVHPFGGGGAAVVDEGGADPARGIEGEAGLFHVIFQQQGSPRIFQPVLDLRPDAGQLLTDLGGHLAAGLLIAEDPDVGQKGQGDACVVPIPPEVGVPEHIKEGPEGVDVFRTPGIAVGAAQCFQQFRVLAGLAEDDEVQTRHLVKVQKLVIGGHLRVVRRLGQQAGDSGRDSNSAEILQHADPLVALHHIEVVEVLHHLDRVPDALLQVDAAQGAPLGGELGVRREDRVEPSGESVPPKVVAGAGSVKSSAGT